MWIQGSTLSISQRSLASAEPASPDQAHAQELAHRLIQGHSSRASVADALAFLGSRMVLKAAQGEEWVTVQVPQAARLAIGLPHGYGVKGGAAREALSAILRRSTARQPRDIDVVRRGSHLLPADEEVARRFMAKDFGHGARVEIIRDTSRYLTTRDLTINELACFGDEITASILCLLDTVGQVVRPSRYRGGSLHRKPSLHGQSLLKMVRLYAEGVTAGESWTIQGIPEEVVFSDFDFAVHLNKAFQRGRPVAERFLATCEVLCLIGASENPIREALDQLEPLRHGERGLFPDVPPDEWNFLDAPGPKAPV